MLVTRWLSFVVAVLLAVPTARAADLSKYLPDDTEIVVSVNATRLIESALVRQHVPTIVKKYGPDLVKIGVAASGKDIDKDVLKAITTALGDADQVRKFLDDNKKRVERITIATTANEADEKAFVVVEGDLNREKIASFLDSLKDFGIKLTKEKAGKHEVYSVKVPGEEEELFFALPDDRTLIAAMTKDEVVKALGRADRTKSGVRKELIELASKIDDKASFWFAAAPKEVDDYVTAIGTFVVTDSVKMTMTVTTKDAEAAKDLADVVKMGLKDVSEGLADFVKDFKPLGSVLDILKKVTPMVEKNVVTLSAELPAATIDELIKNLP